MLHILLLIGVGKICGSFIFIEFEHYHWNELYGSVARIAQRYLKQLFGFGEIGPCVVGHRVHLQFYGDVEVGERNVFVGPEFQCLAGGQHPIGLVGSIGRYFTQAVRVNQRELKMVGIVERYYLVEILEAALLFTGAVVYTCCNGVAAKFVQCFAVEHHFLITLEHKLGVCEPLGGYVGIERAINVSVGICYAGAQLQILVCEVFELYVKKTAGAVYIDIAVIREGVYAGFYNHIHIAKLHG